MDALRIRRAVRPLLTAFLLAAVTGPLSAASYRTRNFVSHAPTPALAKEIGDSAEAWRKKLAIEWLGREMPDWNKPCPIKAKVSPNLGAGGATSFMFDRGAVYGWDMNIQGSRERVLDSVLPHEITHTVFATHFRQPLPRWADEGACTTVEHQSEIAVQEKMLIRFLKTGKGIPFSDMFAMKEYPPDVMPLYSQGHSLTQFLIERRGKAAFLAFLADGMQDEDWPSAVRDHYGNQGLLDLQITWLDWVKAGRPRLDLEQPPTTIAAAATGQMQLASNTTPASAGGKSVYTQLQRTPTPAPPVAKQADTRGSIYDSRSKDTIWR